MEPIVSPVFFYIADTIPAVKCISAIICAVASMAILFSWLLAHDEQTRMPKSLIATFGITLVLAIFVPTQDTLYKMGVASFVTPDNIYYVAELVSDTTDDVANGIKDGVTEFVKDIMSYSADTVNEIRKGE